MYRQMNHTSMVPCYNYHMNSIQITSSWSRFKPNDPEKIFLSYIYILISSKYLNLQTRLSRYQISPI